MKISIGNIKVNILFFLLSFLVFQVFKYPLMIFFDKFFINFISIVFLLPVFSFYVIKKSSLLINSKFFYLFILLLSHLIYSVTILSNDIILAFDSFIQLSLPVLFILILSPLSFEELSRLINKTKFIFYILFFSVIVEIFIPSDFIYQFRNLIYSNKGLAAYSIPLYEFLHFKIRLGSIISEPLLSSHLILLLFILHKNQLSLVLKFFTVFIIFLHGVLSATGALFFFYLGIILNKFSYYFYMICISLFIILIIFSYKFFLDFNYLNNFASTSSHLIGFINGINATLNFNNFLLGNGLGSAGSIVTTNFVYQEMNPEINSLSLGNESTFGILFYQFGFILPLFLISFYLKLSYFFFKNSAYGISGLIIGYLFYMAFSESFITIPNQIFFYIVLLYHYKNIEYFDKK